ncbi:Aste57867_1999 [Aphanomyces stellatus]|uniref:Aste57867_1999 protein n=1 Tax=Aphanomyces stellatus TaxID=120398 RepID=A0A485KAU7_9STRA|nr:hypothetical protein As57867_001997 [Aphanomyces stellatus]VFT79203.1 Aste57867_1999 [Aphanomyces stellatus]
MRLLPLALFLSFSSQLIRGEESTDDDSYLEVVCDAETPQGGTLFRALATRANEHPMHRNRPWDNMVIPIWNHSQVEDQEFQCDDLSSTLPSPFFGDKIASGGRMGPPQGIQFAVSNVDVRPFARTRHDKRSCGPPVSTLDEFKQCTEVLQSSPPSGTSDTVAIKNGFVLGVLRAYNDHHNLVLRPDDVWLAIMVQFSLFVKGHAESLRSQLVKHVTGKKTLEVDLGVGSLRTVNYEHLATQLVELMDEHLVDPTMRDWILPAFTTTTEHDRIVGSVVMMASFSSYFEYLGGISCGIPHVTLLGSVHDWETIRTRVDELRQFGHEMPLWVDLLAPVLDQFVAAANGNIDLTFWQRIAHYTPSGSGPSYLSGWISVFAVFDASGKWQGSTRTIPKRPGFTIFMNAQGNIEQDFTAPEPKDQVTDFPVIEIHKVPTGYVAVDVNINDNGVKYEALMFAGHTSFDVMSSTNSIGPQLTWSMALKK